MLQNPGFDNPGIFWLENWNITLTKLANWHKQIVKAAANEIALRFMFLIQTCTIAEINATKTTKSLLLKLII